MACASRHPGGPAPPIRSAAGRAAPIGVPTIWATNPGSCPWVFAAEAEDVAGEEACSNFELGLTYEEEQGLKQEAERQREEALLRDLYEQNVRLLEQIGELEGAVA
jgi:hypothetical protein